MYRRFLKNLSLLFLLNILIKPLWLFGIDLTVQNSVSVSEYGIYFSLLNFSLLLHILLDLGISYHNNREIAQNPDSLSSSFSSLVSLKAVLAVLYFILALTIAYVIGYDTYRINLLFFLLLNQTLLSYILFFRMNVTALQLFKTETVLSVLDKSLMILVVGFLLWIFIGREDFNIYHFTLGQTAALMPVAFFTFFIVRNKVTSFSFIWTPDEWIVKLKSALPYALLILLMTLYFRMDGVMIERLLGSEGPRQSGIYAASFRLLDAVNILGYLLSTFLLPLFAKLIKEKKSVHEISKISFKGLLVISAAVCISTWFYAENIISFLYTDVHESYASVLRILMITFIPMSVMYVYSTLLTADGKLLIQSKVAAMGLVINFILNIFFILKLGSYGAALATVCTQTFVAIMIYRMASQSFKLTIPQIDLMKTALFILLSLVICFFIHLAIPSNLMGVLLSFLGISALGILLKIIDLKEIKVLMNR